MIKIIENRRLWDVNHKVEAISDTEIKVTVDAIKVLKYCKDKYPQIEFDVKEL